MPSKTLSKLFKIGLQLSEASGCHTTEFLTLPMTMVESIRVSIEDLIRGFLFVIWGLVLFHFVMLWYPTSVKDKFS